ncbi:hypothetical protein BGZ76_007610 [Entomortierella beljakovae]|nr:hypothetical protein BGZ76_007610 [Entomortierella beljakovae]
MISTGSSPRKTLLTTATCIVLLISSCFTSHTDAYVPAPTWGSASTFIEGRALYVQGGSNGSYTVSQAFSIDLSTSWETSNVPMRQLADGPYDYRHSSVLVKGEQSWFLLSNGTGYQYNFAGDNWTNLGGSKNVIATCCVPGTADPVTGLIYIPNAYKANGTVAASTQMLQFDLTNNILTGIPVQSVLSNVVSYSIAWSASIGKMIVFGGTVGGTNNVNNNMYSWDKVNSWVLVKQQGTIPSPRRSSCMVSAYGGKKLILYGGLTDQSNSVLSDIYILDTTTMTWTQGADAGMASARAETACAVTNDLFVSWGGGGVRTVITSNMTIVYNIKKNVWQSNYSPLPVSDDSNGGNGGKDGDSSNSSSSGSNTGAIIGGVVGGLAIIAIGVALFVYRRVRKPGPETVSQQYSAAPSVPPTNGGYAPVNTITPVPVNQPMQYEGYHQPVEQMPMAQPYSQPTYSQPAYSQPAYSQPVYANPPSYPSTYQAYQPPIVHDISQQQQPQIFQPQTQSVQHQAYPSDESNRQQSIYSPTTTASVYSPQTEVYQSPTVYQPSDVSATVFSPTVENLSKPESPKVPPRPPQNPQFVSVPSSYVDSDSARRNPQTNE